MSGKKKAPSTATMLLDPALPLEHRKQLLMHLCRAPDPDSAATVKGVLDAATNVNGGELYAQKIAEVNELLEQMKAGPLRDATFLKVLDHPSPVKRAQVLLHDGSQAFTVLPDPAVAESLRCGDTVLLEASAKALLFTLPEDERVGEEARFERRIDEERVEATLRDHEPCVFRAAAALVEQLDAGAVEPGGTVLVCPHRMMAFESVPKQDGLAHYRYLARGPVPDVVIERDIGAPPAFLEDLTEHVRQEMQGPELGRRYRRRRSAMKLLVGVSGSGKTLCVQGFWRRLYEVMSENTGADMEELPPRVVRLRMSEVLSKWLGESDKSIDRFFDEVDQLSEEVFVAPDGTERVLPLLAICEECDGLARARGDDAIYDRIQTTLLQRLDVTCQKLKDRLVIFLFTTNVPHLVDPAFLRRAGGTTERFGRLSRRQFMAVLGKHLCGLPFVAEKGVEAAEAERRAVADLTAWLFSPNGQDRGQVELSYVGASAPVVKHRRDFLTGALVDRAVQQAAAEACKAERAGAARPGLSAALLVSTFDRQVRAIVDQLHRDNVGQYLDLPDGARVGSVRRIEQPALLPVELERAS
jgi:ATP-dependent 26S proteasome regulatory subunit